MLSYLPDNNNTISPEMFTLECPHNTPTYLQDSKAQKSAIL
jgi:hypothetical protein